MSIFAPSILERFVQRLHISWNRFIILTAVILIGLPLLVAYIDGFTTEFFLEGAWRPLLIAPAIVLYILILQRPMNRSQTRAILALRKVIMMDDESFYQIVRDASRVDARAELVTFGLGGAFGFIMNGPWTVSGDYTLLKIYLPTMSALMFGSLCWIVYHAIASTRLQTALHRQPMEIDIFNIQPFEPIGRHSLLMSVAFIGGCLMSIVLVNPLTDVLDSYSVFIYIFLALVAVLVFFLSMRNTHRVLAKVKRSETESVQKNISVTLHSLETAKKAGVNILEVSTELDLWMKYEERLKTARTWPYNTAMLRTLFLSVLLPAIASLGQRFLSNIFLN